MSNVESASRRNVRRRRRASRACGPAACPSARPAPQVVGLGEVEHRELRGDRLAAERVGRAEALLVRAREGRRERSPDSGLGGSPPTGPAPSAGSGVTGQLPGASRPGSGDGQPADTGQGTAERVVVLVGLVDQPAGVDGRLQRRPGRRSPGPRTRPACSPRARGRRRGAGTSVPRPTSKAPAAVEPSLRTTTT